MKLFRRVSAMAMVLALLLSMSISVFAADFTNMDDGFAYDGEDTEVNINLSNNDGYGNYEAKEGKSYNITTENDSILENVGFHGSGDVVVKTDVNGMEAFGDVDVSVTGEVDSVNAGENATVSIEGNVHNDVAASMEASVAVTGDVGGLVIADGEASVAVTGDVGGSVNAMDEASVAVIGDVAEGVNAMGESSVVIDGDVKGIDGNPEQVDYSDPSQAYSDGFAGVSAIENATVSVTGNVTGGESYGPYGYGGAGVQAADNSTVTVGGNVTGGNVTAPENVDCQGYQSLGGAGINILGAANVTVAGNATGGNTNGDEGNGGAGILYYGFSEEAGSVTVNGNVVSGTATAENGSDGADIVVEIYEGGSLPTITAGSYDSIAGAVYTEEEGYREMTAEELDAVKNNINAESSGESVPMFNSVWNNVLGKIHKAKPGDEVTVNLHDLRSVPAFVIEAARKYDVTLIIKWNGGDDLVITKDFTAEVKGSIRLKDLAEALKK